MPWLGEALLRHIHGLVLSGAVLGLRVRGHVQEASEVVGARRPRVTTASAGVSKCGGGVFLAR